LCHITGIGADLREIMWKKTIRCETAVHCMNSQTVLSYYIKNTRYKKGGS